MSAITYIEVIENNDVEKLPMTTLKWVVLKKLLNIILEVRKMF